MPTKKRRHGKPGISSVSSSYTPGSGAAPERRRGPWDIQHLLHNVPVALAALVLITGSGPGLGKSTLARAATEWLRVSGRHVQVLAEEDIYIDPAFQRVIAECKSSGRVGLSTLLEASSEYLNSIDDVSLQVVVLDALFAYMPSLLAWGYTDHEIAEFMRRMAQLFGLRRVMELHLVGNAAEGLERAGAREGDDWLNQHIVKVSTYQGAPQVSDVQDAAAYLGQIECRAATLLREAPWTVKFLDVRSGFSSVTADALGILNALVDS